jgi:hypothetical protein
MTEAKAAMVVGCRWHGFLPIDGKPPVLTQSFPQSKIAPEASARPTHRAN